MKQIKVFAPATIANLGSGFDVCGLALEGLGDEMEFTETSLPGIEIQKITGANLSSEPKENVVGVAAQAVLDYAGSNAGVSIKIYKGIKPGSGLGSSSASASGAAFGVSKLLGLDLTDSELIQCALKGEELASGAIHADNVAPALLGGVQFVLDHPNGICRRLPFHSDIHLVVLHPQVEVKTSDSRQALPKAVPMSDAIKQTTSFGALCLGLENLDHELLKIGLQDSLATPYRKRFLPEFDALMNAAQSAGALGGGISGSGPTTFYVCHNRKIAEAVQEEIDNVFSPEEINFYTHISPISNTGAIVIP